MGETSSTAGRVDILAEYDQMKENPTACNRQHEDRIDPEDSHVRDRDPRWAPKLTVQYVGPYIYLISQIGRNVVAGLARWTRFSGLDRFYGSSETTTQASGPSN
jgi:hypothetical protein